MSPPSSAPDVRSMSGAEWAMLGLLSLLWGGSFLFGGIAVKEVPVFSIVAFRVALASIALLGVIRVMGLVIPKNRAVLLAFLGMSILNNVIPFNLIIFGQTRIDSGLASILNATTPIFTILLAHLLTQDEKMGLRKGIGVLLGFLGVVVLFSGRDLFGSGAVLGQLAGLGAALSYGFAGIFGKRFSRLGLSPILIAAGQLTVSALIMVPLALMVDRPFSHGLPSWQALLAMIALALVSTAGAYILFFRVLTRAGATNVSLVTLLVPCSAILLGAAVLNEALGLREIGGFAVIALGLLVIDGRALRFLAIRSRS